MKNQTNATLFTGKTILIVLFLSQNSKENDISENKFKNAMQ